MLNTHKDWMAGKSATANNKDDLIQLIKWRSVVTVIASAIKQKPQNKVQGQQHSNLMQLLSVGNDAENGGQCSSKYKKCTV